MSLMRSMDDIGRACYTLRPAACPTGSLVKLFMQPRELWSRHDGGEEHHEKREQDQGVQDEGANTNGSAAVPRPLCETPLEQNKQKNDATANQQTFVTNGKHE